MEEERERECRKKKERERKPCHAYNCKNPGQFSIVALAAQMGYLYAVFYGRKLKIIRKCYILNSFQILMNQKELFFVFKKAQLQQILACQDEIMKYEMDIMICFLIFFSKKRAK